MLIDRLWEVGQSSRSAGPWSMGISAGIAGLLVLCAVVWRWKSFSVAVMLDQALPENEDRWATSLDLLRRQERGETVGATECVERLLEDTEAHTCPGSVIRKVSRRPLIWGGLYLCAVAAGFAYLHGDGFFNLSLLWRRFWDPEGNLPRDSVVVATVLEANGRPIEADAHTIPPLPEGETFSLKVALHR